MSGKTVQVKTFADRKVLLEEAVTSQKEARLSIEDVATYPYKDEEQFAYVTKEDLLDALARFGWLPEEYLKPEPVDPREVKIREVSLALANSDRGTPDRTFEEYVKALGGNWESSAYRRNAVDLINAGLVTVDE